MTLQAFDVELLSIWNFIELHIKCLKINLKGSSVILCQLFVFSLNSLYFYEYLI